MAKRSRWCWCLGATLLLGTGPAWAKKQKEVRQVVVEEVTRVEGKIQKPEVWYLLPRSNLKFEGLKPRSKLVPKIEESIKRDPF